MAMAIILTFLAGGESLEDVDKIRLDEVVAGSPFPHSTTVGDFLRRFDREEVFSAMQQVQDEINRQLLISKNYPSLTLDVDAFIVEAGGKKRRGVAKAYNGKVGFQPLLLFADEPGLLLAHEFRPANVHPGAGATELLDHALTVIPEGTKLHFRSDSACYNKEVVGHCESKNMTFSIAADLTSSLRAEIDSQPEENWHSFGDKGEEVAQLYYQPVGWPKPYRYIVVRNIKGQDHGKNIRYRLFQIGGVLSRHARKKVLKVPRGHPWLKDLFLCKKRILAFS